MIINVLLIAVLTVCVITDIRSRRIYNKIIFPALAAAFLLHGIEEGWSGISFAAAGFAVGLSVLLIPYLMGGMGAGDVKLLALIGAMKGTSFVLAAAVSMALCGGVLALAILMLRRESWAWARWFLAYCYSLRYGVILSLKGSSRKQSATYPYGVAIAGGTALSWGMSEWGSYVWTWM